MSSLLDTVSAVLERVKEVQGEGNLDEVVDDELTMDQVKKKMQEVQMGALADEKKEATPAKAFQVQTDKMETFKTILSRFQGFDTPEDLEAAVNTNYELCDYEFMEMLKSEADACFVEGADIEGKYYLDLINTITKVMANRIGGAQERFQKILSKWKMGQAAMESEVVAMTRRGEIDEALTLLIEANIQQADAAGPQGKPAADALRKVIGRIYTERERGLPDEQRLLRALLREADSEKRKELLYEAFRVQKDMNEEGNFVETAPLIAPPAFINVVRQFISQFGNVEKFDIMNRASVIIDEAQVVATDLYGESMTARDQQKYMFEKQTVSVWDLAEYEHQAVMSGEEVPWRNDKWDNMSPEDVLGEKKIKRIGGDL